MSSDADGAPFSVERMAELAVLMEHVASLSEDVIEATDAELLVIVEALRGLPTSVDKVAALTQVSEYITALRAEAPRRCAVAAAWRADRCPVVCREGVERIMSYLIADAARAWELEDIGGAEALSAAAQVLHERLGDPT